MQTSPNNLDHLIPLSNALTTLRILSLQYEIVAQHVI
jgi:hypothetical protein